MNHNKVILKRLGSSYAHAETGQVFNVVMKSGKGAYLYDANGKRYIDLLSSASSTNVGLCNPHVVHAIQHQAEQLTQCTPTYFANETEAKLAPRLAKLAPIKGPVKISWGTSGADANDSVIKFARAYTHRQYVVSFTGSCHGDTYGAASISGISLDLVRKIGPLLPGCVKVPYPTPWSRLKGESVHDFSQRLFKEFLLPFKTYLPANETAVIIIEPIQGDSGIIKAPTEYLQKVARFAHKHNILLAVDEINQGLGRSGKWWSIQHFPNVQPDLLVTAKSLASGLPLSAVMGRAPIMDALNFPSDTTTTAGNPITAAACSATLDVIKREHLVQRSYTLGRYAKRFFIHEKYIFPFIGNVRMYGLNGGIDIVNPNSKEMDPKLAKKITHLAFNKGLIMITTFSSVLRFQPPLIIHKATLNRAFSILDSVFRKVKMKVLNN